MRKVYQIAFDTPLRECRNCSVRFYSASHQEYYCYECRKEKQRESSRKYKNSYYYETITETEKEYYAMDDIKELKVLYDPNDLFSNGEFDSIELSMMVEDEYMVGSIVEHIPSGIVWKAEMWICETLTA